MELARFFGRFHPLLVHLPIGILMFAFIMEFISRWKKFSYLDAAVPFALFLGSISAGGAAFLGWLLSQGGDYDLDTLWWHQYLGIGVAVFGFVCLLIKAKANKNSALAVQVVLMGLLTFAGHLGGNLTHGDTYLTEYMPFAAKNDDPLVRPPVTDMAQVQLFGDLVHPIVKAKCISCHNKSKQKGQLSFASIAGYLKGGKHGKTIVPGNAAASEILVRVNLDPTHEEFMPTDGKKPLTEEEKTILTYWIAEANADFDTLFLATEPDKEVLKIASNLLHLDSKSNEENLQFPTVSNIDLQNIKAAGFMLRELSPGSHAYDVVLLNNNTESQVIQEKLALLSKMKNNIFWLTLEDAKLQNSDLLLLTDFKNLRKLKLSKNNIDDRNIAALQNLNHLESINLYQTQVSEKSIDILSPLPNLKKIYLWQTSADAKTISNKQKQHDNLEIIAGY